MTASPIALHRRPEILRLGLGEHGRRPVEDYRLPGLWALHRYRYPCRIRAGDHEFTIHPGDLTLFPPDLPLRYRYPGPECRHRYALFALAARGAEHRVAWHHRPEAGRSRELDELLGRAIDAAGRPRAAIALWELLWELTETAADPRAPEERVASRIEEALGTGLTVAELAAGVGLAPDHLTRRFRARYGTTVIGHLRERRLQQAHRLLTTTAIPPAQIARSCGLGDLQYFNKQIRARFGVSPRALQADSSNAL